MKLPQFYLGLIFLTQLCCIDYGYAQDQSINATSSTSYFDSGIKTGSYLPYEIEGVRDLLPIWGIKVGHSVSQTLGLEYDLDMAHAKGVQYFLAYFSLRHDFIVGNVLPLFFILGVDAHYYKRADSYEAITNNLTEYGYKFSSGWHAGFGSETLLYGDIYFRGDFRMGFSPGRQLTVSLAAIYRL